jgi:hypothetical protein
VSTRRGPQRALALYVAFAALALIAYRGVLSAPFVGDDRLYLHDVSFTARLSGENIAAILDPHGEPSVVTMNYAPVQLLLCAFERSVFGERITGYHVANVLLHAGNAVLFTALLLESGAPTAAALLAGLLFLLHPAQAEAVAWISQLKTLAAFAFGFGALRLLWRRPAVAALLFALAVLTKFVVVTLVGVAAALAWVRPQSARERHTWRWLAGWLLIGLAVAGPQLDAFRYSGSGALPPYLGVGERLRTVASIGARYAAMAFTGTGLSALHEPPRPQAWTDPWCLLGFSIGALLGMRLLLALRRRSEEAVWWVCACAGLAPVSQWVPFYYPMGDRYLYFILPGLLGGTVLWASGAIEATPRASLASALRYVAISAGLLLALGFGVRAAQRARVWSSDARVDEDAVLHYPEGTTALYLQAIDAAQRGDAAAAVAALRRAESLRPLCLVRPVHADARLARIRETPEYRAYLREIARFRIDVAERLRLDHYVWLRSTAAAYGMLGDYDEAIALLVRAMREGGPKAELTLEVIAAQQAKRVPEPERR